MDVLWNTKQPYLMLVDDDAHSARLLTRMLLAHGAPSIQWVEDSAQGLSQIKGLLAEPGKHLPGLVIVDLKSSSTAASEFIAEVAGLERSRSLVIAAMAPNLDRTTRDSLLNAGADAVFERHADLQAYRAEAAAIVSFWVRNQHLDAVGT
ncbi:MAG: response regulator transcription factor [Proteobacteria bacterium]|nr:MAG: response regulator transcription factor [Pseudomonadota bacterium]